MAFIDTRHQRAAIVLILLAVALAIALAPYASGLIAVPVLYVIFEPVYQRLRRLTGARLAASIVVVITILLIVIPGVSVVGLLVGQAQDMASRLAAGPLLDRLSQLRFGRFDVGSELAQLGQELVRWLGGNALKLIGTATRFALNLLLALFGLYYLLLTGNRVWDSVRPYVPFSGRNAELLRRRFRDITISTVIGTGLTALAQGTAVALSFAFTGLTDPLFWGVVTLIFAILPVLGSGMVWLPAVAVLLIGGRPGAALFLALWNLGATALIDYGVRPLVFNRFAQIHPLVTLVGAVAGVGYFGLLGLLIGPLALSYFFEILRMYREDHMPAGSGTGFSDEMPVPLRPLAGPSSAPLADTEGSSA